MWKKTNGFWYNVVVSLCWPVFKFLYKFEIRGSENIPSQGKCILCSNHTSNADPVILVLALKRKAFLMAKIELFKNPVLARLFRYFGAFPVNRGRSDKSAISKSEKVLDENHALVIFIEGTRSTNGELLKPKSGAAMISFKTDTKIVPVCISTAGPGKVSLFKKVYITFGESLSKEKLNLKDGTPSEFRNASRLIMSEIAQMKNDILNI